MNDEERSELDAHWKLSNLSEELFSDVSEGHIDDEVLDAAVAHGSPLDDACIEHLSRCQECREVFAAIQVENTDEIAAPAKARIYKLSRVVVPLALAAGVAGLTISTNLSETPKQPPRGATRGAPATIGSGIALIAIQGSTRRDLKSGDRLQPSDQIGFVYSNPQGEHRTLTILGLQAGRILWLYPESGDLPATKVAHGPKTIAIRLPFDEDLSDHPLGPLQIVAGFDISPQDLADDVKEGRLPKSVTSFDFTITSSRAHP